MERMNTTEIDNIMKSIAAQSKRSPPLPLANQIHMMQVAKDGYPVSMYHERLPPKVADKEEQEVFLREQGYSRTYKHHEYPKMLVRRNFDQKFDGYERVLVNGVMHSTNKPEVEKFVESKIAKSEAEEKALKSARVPTGCGPWVDKITDIEPMPAGPAEPQSVAIARMQAEMAQMQERLAAAIASAPPSEIESADSEPKKRGPGRPPKVNPDTEE